jgi:hypothetical protein
MGRFEVFAEVQATEQVDLVEARTEQSREARRRGRAEQSAAVVAIALGLFDGVLCQRRSIRSGM